MITFGAFVVEDGCVCHVTPLSAWHILTAKWLCVWTCDDDLAWRRRQCRPQMMLTFGAGWFDGDKKDVHSPGLQTSCHWWNMSDGTSNAQHLSTKESLNSSLTKTPFTINTVIGHAGQWILFSLRNTLCQKSEPRARRTVVRFNVAIIIYCILSVGERSHSGISQVNKKHVFEAESDERFQNRKNESPLLTQARCESRGTAELTGWLSFLTYTQRIKRWELLSTVFAKWQWNATNAWGVGCSSVLQATEGWRKSRRHFLTLQHRSPVGEMDHHLVSISARGSETAGGQNECPACELTFNDRPATTPNPQQLQELQHRRLCDIMKRNLGQRGSKVHVLPGNKVTISFKFHSFETAPWSQVVETSWGFSFLASTDLTSLNVNCYLFILLETEKLSLELFENSFLTLMLPCLKLLFS